MKDIWRDRRRVMALALTALLAACQIVPKSTAPSTPAPLPSDSELPDDDGRHRVALLVPLAGKNAAVGQSLANATTMALLDTNANNLRITTYDTSAGARQAAARAVSDGNRLVLGPLLGENIDDVVSQTRSAKIPLISFSNDVTTASRDVFLMGHMPGQSIDSTVSFARKRGSRQFAALIPEGDYGRRVELALAEAVAREGGSVTAIEKYDRGSKPIVASAKKLRDRGGFDTLLIADGARLAALGANQWPQDSSRPQLLGPELWSGEDGVANSNALQGAWFSAVSDKRYGQFVKSYQSRFGSKPYRVATLGYDAVLLTLRIAQNWTPGRAFPTSRLTDSDGFLGLDGPFRFNANGIGERAMEVREVRNGTIAVVSSAPARFDD